MIHTWQEHIKKGGRTCPHCGSENLTFADVDCLTDLTAHIKCMRCGEDWLEYFKLTAVGVDGKYLTAD